jgi:predicted membrane protein
MDVETPSAAPRARLHFGQIVVGVVLVVLGVVWLLDVLGAIDLRAAVVLPALLAAVGVALMMGSLRGPHPGLVAAGVVLTVITLFAALTPAEALRGGIGQRRYLVTRAADLRSEYEVGIGDLTLDLSSLDLTSSRSVTVTVGAGDLKVIVPDGIALAVEASSGAGEIVVLDERSDGLSPDVSYRSPGYAEAVVQLELDLELGAGRIEVRR